MYIGGGFGVLGISFSIFLELGSSSGDKFVRGSKRFACSVALFSFWILTNWLSTYFSHFSFCSLPWNFWIHGIFIFVLFRVLGWSGSVPLIYWLEFFKCLLLIEFIAHEKFLTLFSFFLFYFKTLIKISRSLIELFASKFRGHLIKKYNSNIVMLLSIHEFQLRINLKL